MADKPTQTEVWAAPPISQQLSEQGLRVANVEQYQANAEAITRLYIWGLLTEAETGRARKRLAKLIFSAAASTEEEDAHDS